MPATIGVVSYSTWGHINTLSDSVAEGLEKSGVTVKRYLFKEILSEEIRGKMYAAPKPDYPDITPDDLKALDGFIFCMPTRYGRAPAAVDTFFDQTGGLWATGALVGKFAGIVTSAGSQHGGHESTALTTFPFFAHHGIIFVPIGFVRPELSIEDKVIGGSAYGASSVAGGKGTLSVLDEDKAVAAHQGESFGKLVSTFLKGAAAPATAPTAAAAPAAEEAKPAEDKVALGAPVAPSAAPSSTETAPVAPAVNGSAVPPQSSSAAVPEKPKAAPPAKKKSFFASCCGGDGSDLKA